LDVLRGKQESCTETCSASSGDGKQFVFVNVDDDTVIKQQEDPEPTASNAINSDPLVSCMFCVYEVLTNSAQILTVAYISICPHQTFGLINRFLTEVMKLPQ
jgi:phosphatidate phosphatase APP1